MSNSIIASSASILCRRAAKLEIDPAPLMKRTGLDYALVRDPNARYDSASVDQAWHSLAAMVSDPCFGLKAADCWHPSDLHALGYAWLASSSLRAALERLCRYAHIVSDVDDFLLDEIDRTLSIKIENRGLPPKALWPADSTMAVILSMCRINYGETLEPESVQFIHPEPACAGEYYRFFRCPVQFNAKENRINLSLQIVDEQLAGANAQLVQVNDQIMIKYLAQLDKNDVVQRVKSAIIEQLPSGAVTDTMIASLLNRNVRTLQRQLSKEDDTSMAAFITGFVVESIVHQCHWKAHALTKKQKMAVWIVMLEMAEHVCYELDTTAKLVASYAAMWVFRDDNSYMFGTMIREMEAEYRGLRKQQKKRTQLVLLNRSINALLIDGDISHTKRIARVANMLAGSSELWIH